MDKFNVKFAGGVEAKIRDEGDKGEEGKFG